MKRSDHFKANVLEYDQREIASGGCPYCGHHSADHSWTGDQDCLRCDCKGWTFAEGDDDKMTMLSTGEVFSETEDAEAFAEEIRQIFAEAYK